MARDTVRVIILLDKRGVGIEGVTAFSAEEVPNMPFCACCHYHLALDGRLAASAAGTEEFVKVQVAVESQLAFYIVVADPLGFETLQTFVFRFWVECHALKRGGAVVAREAFWVESCFEGGRGSCA
jgi:hypothetical protein